MADHQKHDVPVESSLAKQVKEEQSKTQEKAHEVGHEAKKTAHETKETAKDKYNRAKKGELSEEEKKKFLATAGAVVAFVAAVAFGGYKYHQHRKTKREELEEQAGTVAAKAKRFGHWFGSKAGEAKDVASDNLGKATSNVPHPHLGRSTEKSLMRASEKSDAAVRSTYDKAADTAEAAKNKAKGLVGASEDKAEAAKNKAKGAAGASDHKGRSLVGSVKGAAHSVQDKASDIAHAGKDKAYSLTHHSSKDASKYAHEAKESAKETLHEEKHGFLGGIKGWLGDRKDELEEAARIGRKEQEYVSNKAHYEADRIVQKVKN